MSNDVPLTNESVDEKISDETRALISEQQKELSRIDGLSVTGVRFPGGGAPPRFDVVFSQDRPMYVVRQEIEALKFDVGNQLKSGEKDLSFYVTKRVTHGDGWSV